MSVKFDKILGAIREADITTITTSSTPMFQQVGNDAQVVQSSAGFTFTAGLGATAQVTLSGAYSGTDITFKTDTDGANNSGTTLKIIRDVTNGTDTGEYLRAETSNATNVASFKRNQFAFGQGALASGGSSFAALSGSTASGDFSVAMGKSCGASGYSSCGFSSEGKASGPYAATFGYQAKGYAGGISHAIGNFSEIGDSQHTLNQVMGATADATPKVLTYIDWGAGYNKQILPASSTWTFVAKIACYNTTDNLAAGWNIRGVIRRNAANSTVIIGTNITEAWQEGAMSVTDCTVTADDTNEAIQITVTGIASKSMRWHGSIETSEVSFGTP